MKRASEGLTPPPKRATIVRLNTGGYHFETTKDTVSKCTYFLPYLEGRMDHAVDEDDGSLFVDRNGQFFGHLLQFMRTTLCPIWSYVTRNRQELPAECEYFGLEHMAHRIRGETSPYDMRPEDRCIKQPEADAGSLLNVFESERTPWTQMSCKCRCCRPRRNEHP